MKHVAELLATGTNSDAYGRKMLLRESLTPRFTAISTKQTSERDSFSSSDFIYRMNAVIFGTKFFLTKRYAQL